MKKLLLALIALFVLAAEVDAGCGRGGLFARLRARRGGVGSCGSASVTVSSCR